MNEKETLEQILTAQRQAVLEWVLLAFHKDAAARAKIQAELSYDLKDLGLEEKATALDERMEALTSQLDHNMNGQPEPTGAFQAGDGSANTVPPQQGGALVPRRRGRPPKFSSSGDSINNGD